MTPNLPVDLPIPADSDRTSKGIALSIGQLISSGHLPPGTKLPPVRTVARQLGVSPTTVGDAWRILRSYGAIITEGRRGTFVRIARHDASPGRYWRVPVDPGVYALDLSTGTPDPDLLPQLGPVLSRVPDLPVTSYLDVTVLPELEQLLRADWPFAPEMLTIVDGAQDALDRVVSAIVNVGDRVVVNDPAFPPLLDVLEIAGAQVIGLAMDEEGVVVSELEAALAQNPVAFFLQPRSHNPTGISMSGERAAELAKVLSGRGLTIVEDDHSGDVSGATLQSLGAHLPNDVVHIRSFSKSHGPDLRLACIGGAVGPIDTVVRRRRLGPSWSSRLLQGLLLTMLEDGPTAALIARANDEYARRRRAFVEALGQRGVAIGGSSGLNLWVPVADEQHALVALAAQGVGVAPGSPFHVGVPERQHIRVSIGTVTDGVDRLADLIADAAAARAGGQRASGRELG